MKKHALKAVLSMVLTIAMVMGMLPLSQFTVKGDISWSGTGITGNPWLIGKDTADNIEAVLDDNGELTISGTGEMTEFENSSTGRPWSQKKSDITSVKMGEDITSIGGYAFYDCSNLTTVTLPGSLTCISSNAFQDCEKLESITTPEGVTSIRSLAFSNCKGLKTVYVSGNVTSIERGVFRGCNSLTSINIPDSVTSIGEDAFYDCNSLTEIKIPNGVKSIGGNAFNNCNKLTTITIPGSVTSIGERAFLWCTDLTAAFFSNSTESIELSSHLFDSCTKLETVYVSENWKVEGKVTGLADNTELNNKLKYYKVLASNDNYPAENKDVLSGSTTGTLTVPDGFSVTLVNATIKGGIVCSGNATITLAGENTVTALDNHAGIYVPRNKTLTINGDGKLDVTGGGGGAGIGGYFDNYGHSCGNIIINSGEVTATGGNMAAGIGGAYDADFGDITINNGNITARGGVGAAGIGGGCAQGRTTGGNIYITDGTVKAYGGSYATGIGTGTDSGNCGNILISGGKIEAVGGSQAAGIGGSQADAIANIRCGDIVISDEVTSLKATGGEGAEYSIGKGNGSKSSCGTVTIGGVVTGFISEKKFTTKPLQMVFEADGGTDEMDAKKVMENLTYVLPTCTFIAPVGKMFKEWSVKIGNADAVTKAAEESVKITANTTLTAVWKDRISTDIPDAIGNLTYDGTEKTGVVAGTGYTITGNKATNAGSYSATAVLDAEYKWSDVTIADREISWTIAPKTVTSPTIEIAEASYTYTGTEIKPTVTVKDGETTIPVSEYTVSYKDNINAGTATVTITDNKDGNYTVSGSKTFTINKATPSYEAPTVLKATTGQTLANVTLPDGWAWADKTLSVGDAGTNVFKATYTPADTTNYNVVENIELTVTVSKASGGSSGGGTSNGGTSNGGSTGGNTSGGGSGAAGSGTADKDKTTTTPVTEKKTNADGSVTETTKTTNPDGSKTETEKTTAADGTVTETKKTTATDGSVKETGKTTTSDGIVTETEKTTSVEGTVKETEKTSDASGTVTEKTSVTEKDGSGTVSEKVTEKDGSSSSTTVTVGSDGKAKNIVATESDGKKDSQTVSFEVKGNKVSVSAVESTTGIATIPSEITAADGKTYKVTKIDKDAFDGKKIKELNLSDSVKVIAPKALAGTNIKKLNLKGENIKLKKNCLKDTNKNLVITVTTKSEKKKLEKQLKKAGNPTAKVKVSKKKA